MKRLSLILAFVVLGGACASDARFKDEPIVWEADDRRDIPEPEETEFYAYQYFGEVLAFRALTRAMELRDREPARNTNALDEVPNSSWFTNRIGAQKLRPEEVQRGPDIQGPPQAPFTIVSGKTGGGNKGFIVSDARGVTYIVKFDTKNNPEMQTATNIIVNRFFWAIGYNVPADYVFKLRKSELKIKKGARYKDAMLDKHPIDQAFIDDVLLDTVPEADGRYRATASEFLAGIPKGGWVGEGTRDDDPNDVVAHEHRRELRGLKVFSAWLGHTDMKDDNTLEMFVEDDNRRYLRRYLVDFGEALGSHQAEKIRYEDGWEHVWDWQYNTAALFAFGFWERPWERQQDTVWLSIGAFGSEQFEPEEWREAYPYWPFKEADASDLYWGAKIVMRFDRKLIRAIVDTGELSAPGAAEYLTDALVERRDKIGHAWLEGVSPLDYFTVNARELCAWDLGVLYGLASDGVVEWVSKTYRPDFDDTRGEEFREVDEYRVNGEGRVCIPIDDIGDTYSIARLRTRRGKDFRPIMQVHFKGGKNARILGIIRVEDD